MAKLRFNKLLFVIYTAIISAIVSPIPTQAQTMPPPTQLEVASVMDRVNDSWISQHPEPGDNEWARAVYYIGDIAHYMTTGGAHYLD
jgi:unsaturated rhamnogalacturonyl hydrolase